MATPNPSNPAPTNDQELQRRLLELRAAVARQRAARSGAAELRDNPSDIISKPSSAESKRSDSIIGQLENLKTAQNSSLYSAHYAETTPSSLEGSFRPSELLESSVGPSTHAPAPKGNEASRPDEQELADFQAILRAAADR